MAKKYHGTPGAYNDGCRCRKCLDCKAARAWAERKVREWDAPLKVDSERSFTHGGIVIPAWIITKAVAAHEKQIKTDALKQVWEEMSKNFKINKNKKVTS